MKKTLKTLIVMVSVCALLSADVSPQERYIAAYAETAVREMYRSGVPASITLAQGLLESRYGLSELASKGNNHFGIKCHDWKGRTMKVDDERKGECFRVYDSADESYQDHSDFLRFKPRYRGLFELDVTDYKGWAYGLSKAGYATDPHYAPKLIKIIEDYDLSKYDLVQSTADVAKIVPKVTKQETSPATPHKMTRKEAKAAKKAAKAAKEAQQKAGSGYSAPQPTPQKPVERRHIPVSPSSLEQPVAVAQSEANEQFHISLSRKVYKQNGVPFIYAEEGDTYANIAENNGLFKDELLRYNDLKSPRELTPGDVVYLKGKKTQAAKGLDKHIVDHDGDSLWDICQHYGVRQKDIERLNGFEKGHSLREGDTILLRRDAK